MLNNATGFDRIYIACGYTDLRQGIDGLCTVIRRQLDIDPFQKNVLFMFCGRKPDKIKCLIWEGDGFLLLYKRLLDGRYQWPRTKQEVMEMTQEQFEWLMSGQSITPTIRKGLICVEDISRKEFLISCLVGKLYPIVNTI